MARELVTDVTDLLAGWRNGEPRALDRLISAVYDELAGMARRLLRRERVGHTLETAGLIHEAYLRLARRGVVGGRDRSFFFAVAARTMRRILIEHARRRESMKRGGRERWVPLTEVRDAAATPRIEVLALDAALRRLALQAPAQARIVELRLFGGLTATEIGEVLGISTPTVTRRWRVARAWLYRELVEGAA